MPKIPSHSPGTPPTYVVRILGTAGELCVLRYQTQAELDQLRHRMAGGQGILSLPCLDIRADAVVGISWREE